MISFKAVLVKFDENGEKTGWTFFEIPAKTVEKINPGVKKSYRVKGTLDKMAIHGVSVLPMGEGEFIMPVNAAMRKTLGKKAGDSLQVKIELDREEKKISEELLMCLADDPKTLKIFMAMPMSHQRYYSNWVESAKTESTRGNRITKIMKGLPMGLSFGEIMKMEL